jgi:hypothetical protein
MKKPTLIVLIAIALGATVAMAQPLLPLMSSSPTGNFNITAITDSSNDAKMMSSGSYRLIADSGEPTGKMGSDSYRLCIGWWCGVNTLPYNVSISGKLSYADGRPVANAPVSLTAWNSTYFKYTGDSKTESDGTFVLSINEMPDALFDQGYFVIEIYATGVVEAAYRCLYNVTDGVCKMI